MSIATLRGKLIMGIISYIRLKMRIEAHNCKIFQNKKYIYWNKTSHYWKNHMIAKFKKLLRRIEKLYLINCFTLLMSFGSLILNNVEFLINF